jgi:hypothetical protein
MHENRSALPARRLAAAGATLLAALSLATVARATPGTHPLIVSTWDTTSSSVNGAFTGGFFPGGRLYFGSYYSSFSSTSGKLSAQFGAHYANYLAPGQTEAVHGGAGTAALVYNTPTFGRYDSGLPRVAFGFYLGAAPTVLIGGKRNYVWVPAAAGLAMPLSPHPRLTFVPWFEVAGGLDFDSVIRTPRIGSIDASTMYNPVTQQVTVTQKDIDKLVSDAFSYQLHPAVTVRGGLSLAVHLGDVVDLGASGTIGHVQALSSALITVFVGGSLQIHWDDTVPAVLPPSRRLEQERCEDVAQRLQECPISVATSSRRP